MIPKTAGKILNEEEIRAYMKCSKFYSFGGKVQAPILTDILQYVFERLTSHVLRTEIGDPLFLIQSFIQKAIYSKGFHKELMDQQVAELVRRATLCLDDLFRIFTIGPYLPVYGPIDYRIKVSKTPLDLNISGIFRLVKNQTLHAVQFTPYINPLDMQNDPITHMKLKVFSKAVKPHGKRRPQVKLHQFSIDSSNSLVYNSIDSNLLSDKHLKIFSYLISEMERGVYFPRIPCNFMCPYKQKCKPK